MFPSTPFWSFPVLPSAAASFLAHSSSSGAATTDAAGTRDVVWYPDSGAMHHITNDRANLQSDMVYTGMESLIVGNVDQVHISCVGFGDLLSGNKTL